jgi:hypothetical protein
VNSSEIVDLFRKEVGDTRTPYLWDDEEAYAFLDDAQSQFCRKTDGIADSRTAAVCNLAVVPGTDWYTTHASILNIRKITRADTGRKVEMLTAEQADTRGIVFLATTQGVVRQVVLGLEPHAVRIAPMPNETVTLNLQVYRLPLEAITDAGEQVLEIDLQHHQHLLLWMKHRAYDKQDVETYDRTKSGEFETRFDAYCFKVKQEQARARRVHGNVAYGGL